MNQVISKDAYTKTAIFVLQDPYYEESYEEFADDEYDVDRSRTYQELDVDLFMNENILFDAVVSREAIEDGSAIHDHIAVNPVRMRMNGIMNPLTSGPKTGEEKWNEITNILKSESLLKIITHYGVYENMVMTNLQTQIDLRGIRFDASFEQMKIVGSANLYLYENPIEEEEVISVDKILHLDGDGTINDPHAILTVDESGIPNEELDIKHRDQIMAKIEEFEKCPTEENKEVLYKLSGTAPLKKDINADHIVIIGGGDAKERIVFSRGSDKNHNAWLHQNVVLPIQKRALEALTTIEENARNGTSKEVPSTCSSQKIADAYYDSRESFTHYEELKNSFLWAPNSNITNEEKKDEHEENDGGFLSKIFSTTPPDYYNKSPEDRIRGKKDVLFFKRNSGLITEEEYNKQLDELKKEELQLKEWRTHAGEFDSSRPLSTQPHVRARQINERRNMREKARNLRNSIIKESAIERGEKGYLERFADQRSKDGVQAIEEQERLERVVENNNETTPNFLADNNGKPIFWRWNHSGSPRPESISTQSPFFSSREFECKGTRSNGHLDGCLCDQSSPEDQVLSSQLIEKLEALRKSLNNVPINITSGYRCRVHNARVDGVDDSRHLQGTAADIYVNGVDKERLASLARSVGFGYVQTYPNKSHVHVDVR